MAASSSKPAAVHYALAFFVLLSLVLGLFSYVEHGAALTAHATSRSATEKQMSLDRDFQRLFTELETMKTLARGASAPTIPEVGSLTSPAPGTLIDTVLKEDFSRIPMAPGETSYRRLIDTAVQELRTRREIFLKANAELEVQRKAFVALESKYNALLAEEKTARTGSESQLRDVARSKAEVISSLELDIQELQAEYAELDTASANAKLAYEKEQKSLKQKNLNLTAINQQLVERIEQDNQRGGDIPTANLLYVDTQNKLAYIDKGEADLLPKGLILSVYPKSSRGSATGTQSKKGTLEVLRTTGAHTAECRIVTENIYEPFAQGDPVYTPLWFPGQQQHFAFVSLCDLDGDGQDDRQELHELLSNAHAVIDAELLPNGDLQGAGVTADTPTGITEQTRFLVIGKVPELQDATTDAQRTAITKTYQHLRAMKDAAREQGVRVMNLTDFLSHVGYRPSRRLFKPGEEVQLAPKSTPPAVAPNRKSPIGNGIPNRLFRSDR